MRVFLFIVAAMLSVPALANNICQVVNGSVLIAQDFKNTYLGKIANNFDSESIFNEFGTYGSKYSTNSIWNEFSTYGSKYSTYSPFNEFTLTPPMIVKNNRVIGYLSANKNIEASIAPDLLKALCGN